MRMAEQVARSNYWAYSLTNATEDEQGFQGFFFAKDPSYPGTWLTGLHSAQFALAQGDETYYPFPPVNEMVDDCLSYTVQIDAEQWQEGHQWPHWAEEDTAPGIACSPVHVTFANGVRWTASFITYRHVETLRRECQNTGRFLGGNYLYIDDMVLVESLDQRCVEAVISDMLHMHIFDLAFYLESVDHH